MARLAICGSASGRASKMTRSTPMGTVTLSRIRPEVREGGGVVGGGRCSGGRGGLLGEGGAESEQGSTRHRRKGLDVNEQREKGLADAPQSLGKTSTTCKTTAS